MRKSRQETEATRKRIVKTASETFRSNGISETGLKDLMQGAGLETPGGFYKHFGSKEQLVTEAISLSISQILEWMKASIIQHAPRRSRPNAGNKLSLSKASRPGFRGMRFLGYWQ